MLNELRLTLRSFGKNPGFASVAIVTLALGIGASTAIFTVMNGVLLRPLPYPESGRLVHIETVFESRNTGRVSYPNFEDLREQNRSLARMAAYAARTTSATAGGEGFRVDWAHVSPGFFSVLGVTPAAGRVFNPDEERAGRHVAVVSRGYWQSRLGGTEDFESQSVRVGERVYDIIGVLPRGYEFPLGTDIWVPRDPAAESRTAHNWNVMARLQKGVSQARAQQDLTAIARRLKQQHGDDTFMIDAAVRPLLERLVGDVRTALWVLLGAAGLLLLVACVNVANLSLARALSRDRESSLRVALGAGPGALARLFLTESVVLSLSGAALGVLLARAGVSALLALEPGRLTRVEEIGVDWRVLVFALASSALVALVIGLVPAIRAMQRDMRGALVDSRRIQGDSPASYRLRGVLVVAQISLTIVLLVGAGLLGRSLLNLLTVDPGFRTDGAVVMDIWLPESCSSSFECDAARAQRNANFIGQLIERLRGLPGVERVGGINHLPLDGGGPNGIFIDLQNPDEIADFEDYFRFMPDPTRAGNAEFRVASQDYFATMGIPLIRWPAFRRARHARGTSRRSNQRFVGRDPLARGGSPRQADLFRQYGRGPAAVYGRRRRG